MAALEKAEYLTPLTGDPKRKRFVVLDLESKDGDSQKRGFTRPFMAGFFNGTTYTPFFDSSRDGWWQERYWREGGCIDRLMTTLLVREYAGTHIYAHNAGKFDYLFLLPWLMVIGRKRGFRFKIIPVASAIQVLDVWHMSAPYRVWRFLDSYRLIPIALDKAAKAFKLQGKKKHDLDLPETDPSWKDYNQQDCVELYRVLEQFHHYIENVLCGEVGITAPSTSMKLFRRRYLKHELYRARSTHAFVREGYYGGRVESFEAEGWDLSYFDINSSYPFAMLSEMPVGEAVEWKGKPPSRITDSRIGFVRANVFVPPAIDPPPLPVRGRKEDGIPDGKLIFPVGKLHGVWEMSELEMALEQGARVTGWFESVWYEPQEIFADFVRDLYQYRDTSRPDYDEGLAQVVKILLNSLYGKFGMRTIRRKLYLWDDPNLPPNAKPASNEPECPVWYAEEESDAPYVMPQVSARVTALARVNLYRHMLAARKHGGRVYYVDTDSIITDVRLPTSTKLGDLKDEIPEHSGRLHGRFYGPKLYVLTAEDYVRVKAKGIEQRKKTDDEPQKDVVIRARETVEKLARGETIYQRRFEKIGSLARAGFMRGPEMLLVPRTLRPDQGKRVFRADGTSRPHRVSMY